MKIKIKDKDGIILKTENTLVDQDIQVVPDTTGIEPENILAGTTILGVVGTATTGTEDSKNLTATSGDILEGKTALVKGNIITGTIKSQATKE
jgi:hypothetical protein